MCYLNFRSYAYEAVSCNGFLPWAISLWEESLSPRISVMKAALTFIIHIAQVFNFYRPLAIINQAKWYPRPKAPLASYHFSLDHLIRKR